MELLGISPAISELREEIAQLGPTDCKVLITGESGVGKEVVARLLHRASRRSHGPFDAVNAAGVPDTLLESALFGHVRGAFTGADRDRAGHFEACDGGTLLLDEVGEMSPRMQSMLLRVLENGEIMKVGDSRARRVTNVRIITATNRDLRQASIEGKFREDLYYRLNVVHLQIPPLRERREDIAICAYHFVQQFGSASGQALTLDSSALDRLIAYHWPGNVRQLKHALESAVARVTGNRISARHLPPLEGQAQLKVQSVVASSDNPADDALAEVLFQQLLGGGSFWTLAYEPLMRRDLTRATMRGIIERGLRRTCGSYRALVALLGLPPREYKRFLVRLRKLDCQVPYREFRNPAVTETLSAAGASVSRPSAAGEPAYAGARK